MTFRFAIGIDLGTTNSALAFQPMNQDENCECQILSIPQLSDSNKLEENQILNSCCYLPTPYEIKHSSLSLPWDNVQTQNKYAVGLMAYHRLSTTPELVVQSAKSWLSFSDVNRTSPILPWGNNELPSDRKISPLEASARYLKHLKDAWNFIMAKENPPASFEKQSITITVPASFDEVAQQLTLQAAKIAGYPGTVRLLEEPQAVFYNWLRTHSPNELSQDINNILICDIGGGTSDFSLFNIKRRKGEKLPIIERVSVSSHLLLGGDNIDLTIALILEKKLSTKLSHQQWTTLVFQAKQIKERILSTPSEDDSTQYHISLANNGSSLFSSTLTTSITRQEITKILIDGFFPFCTANAKPKEKTTGLKEFGLPYVNDTAITKHLASFLDGTPVDAIIFNGGTIIPSLLQKKLLTLITAWQNDRKPLLLKNNDMKLAVALGASQYSKNIFFNTNKISANYPRSVYLELENNNSNNKELLCILPKGFEIGYSINIPNHFFLLTINKPVRFQIFTSRMRSSDSAGTIVQYNSQDFHPLLPPLQTTIKSDKKIGKDIKEIKVQIKSGLTETGLLNIQCVTEDGELLSPLSFMLKNPPQNQNSSLSSDNDKNTSLEYTPSQLEKCSELIDLYYGKGNKQTLQDKASTPKTLIKDLEKIMKTPREEWSLPFMRSLWKCLSQGITRRNRSLAHECTWLNLTGFILRPGYGAELDSFRIDEVWKLFELGLSFPKEKSSQLQWAVLWRRIAGGLSRERQQLIFKNIQQLLSKANSDNPELFRLLASLERLDSDQRVQIGNLIVKRLLRSSRSGQEEFCWAFGRLATRVPLYGELNSVVSSEKVTLWFTQLKELDWSLPQYQQLNNAFSLSARQTNDRNRDLSPEIREEIIQKMTLSHAPEAQFKPLKEFIEVQEQDQSVLFGESLPSGLKKVAN